MSGWTILGLATAFLSAGGLAQKVSKSRIPEPVLIGLVIVAVGLHLLTFLALPFHAVWGEIPLVLTAAAALTCPMALLMRTNRRAGGLQSGFYGGGFLLTAFLTLFPLTVRMNYAYQLTRACDGRIVEHDRSSNHRATRIAVESAAGRETFEGVDEQFWGDATTGRTLAKKAGSPMALLDGTPIRMLIRVKFWNDPP